MRELAATDLERVLGTAKRKPVYCLEGADQGRLDLARGALIGAVGGRDPAFQPGRYDMGDVPLSGALDLLREAIGDLNTAPMFGPRKLVFLSGLERVLKRMGAVPSAREREEEEPEAGRDRSKEAAEESEEAGSLSQLFAQTLESYLRAPSPYGVLVLEAEKLDRRKRLGKLLSDSKLCQQVDVSSPAEASEWDKAELMQEASAGIAALARDLGLVLKGSALAELSESVQGDLGLARAVLLKLRDYIAPRTEIESADVAEMVPAARSGIIFDLLAAFASGEREQGITLMRNLYSRGERGPRILGGLHWVCEVLLRVKELAAEGREREAYRIRGFAPRDREFALVASKLSRDTLISWIVLLARTDVAIRSSPPDEQVVLEFLAARMTAAATRAKR